MKTRLPMLDVKKYQKYIAVMTFILVIVGVILVLSGIIYVIYTERYTEKYMSELARGVHAQTFLEMILVTLGYLIGLIGLLVAYFEFKRAPKRSEDLVLLGIALSFIAWLLIHYLYLWKRGI